VTFYAILCGVGCNGQLLFDVLEDVRYKEYERIIDGRK